MTVSLRARLTLWYIVVLVVVLCGAGGAVVWMDGRLAVARVDRELQEIEATAARIIHNELDEHATAREAASEACETVVQPNVAVAVIERNATLLAATPSGPVRELVATRPNLSATTIRSGSGAWRTRSGVEQFGGTTLVVAVAVALDDVEREQGQLAQAMIVGILIALLLAGAGGW